MTRSGRMRPREDRRRLAALVSGAAVLVLVISTPSVADASPPARATRETHVATAAVAPSATPHTRRTRTASAPDTQVRIELLGESTFVDSTGTYLAGLRITGAPAGSEVVVSIHDLLRSRAAFDATADDVPRHSTLATFPVIPLDPLAPDAFGGRTVSVTIPIRGARDPRRPGSYRLDSAGVYPLRISVRDRDGDELTHVVTDLIRLPTAAEQVDASARLRVAPLLPLRARPTLQPDGRRRRPADDLARMGIVLGALVSEPALAATLVPTPEAVDALGRSRSADDQTLLRRLRAVAAAPGRQVLATTYVPVDAAAWVSDGLGAALRHQRDRAALALDQQLGRPDNGTWVADTDLTPAAVSGLRESGIEQLVVPESSLTPVAADRFPDDLSQPFKVSSDAGVPTPAVQIDQRLSEAFTHGADERLRADRLIAQLAVISFAQRGTAGAVVLSPPAGWHPSKVFLSELFTQLSTPNPLLTTSTLDQVFAEVPPAGASGAAALHLDERGGDLVRQLAPASPTSLGSYPVRLNGAQVHLAAFASMVGAASQLPAPYTDRLDVSGSSDLGAVVRLRYVDAVDTDLAARFAAVTAPPREKVTLAARDASFPLSLSSSLPYPVTVLVQMSASNRLSFPDGTEKVVTLRGARTRVKLHVRAVSGDTPLRVTVLSPDGSTVLPGATTRYTVRSTAVSGVGIVLTVGAATFLLLWWASHWRSSRRPGRHARARRRGNHPPAEQV